MPTVKAFSCCGLFKVMVATLSLMLVLICSHTQRHTAAAVNTKAVAPTHDVDTHRGQSSALGSGGGSNAVSHRAHSRQAAHGDT